MIYDARTPPVNPERPGESGRWVMQHRTASRSATCVHTWQYRNALGIAGGPVVKACTGCGETKQPTWVPDAVARPALPAAAPAVVVVAAIAGPAIHRAWPFVVGDAEWADLLRERSEA